MNHNDHLEQRLATGVKDPTMTLIQPKDILLGRGPTRYNNPGNRVFRKLVKEHVKYYNNQARQGEKAALVKMLVAKLEAMGSRFLQRSSTGTWIEAPPQAVEKKVGHGLRDARLAVTKNGGDGPVLPKNSPPATTEQKLTDMDILQGRGPTCYNNPGNKVFRKLLNENFAEYVAKTRRKDKAALVMSLVSKIEAKGYRFLRRSTAGEPVEVSPKIVKKSVSQGFRNALHAATKKAGDISVLPENFHPATTEKNSSGLVVESLLDGEANTSEEMRVKTSDDMAVIDTGVQTHFHTTPTELQINPKRMVASSSASSPSMPSVFAVTMQELALADGGRQSAEVSSFVAISDEKDDLRGLSSERPGTGAANDAHDLDATATPCNVDPLRFEAPFYNSITDEEFVQFWTEERNDLDLPDMF